MATTDRYDRQLRLWGSHGQRALMQTHILLVNADAAGTETLKNCVLPGVGRFTIVDGAKVSEDDAGNNFFVHLADKGRPRAEVCAAYLTEMNADVKGASVVADPETYDFEANLAGYSIVVASNLSDALLGRLAALCWVRRVPLVAVSSNGFLCTYRLQVRDHGIVESKIDQSQRGLELSLATPFPALRAFCAQFDLPSLDFAAHSHVPYVAVLLQTADEWRTAHGSLPSSFKEKQAFRELVRSQARDLDEEANFQEASEKAYQAYAVEPLSDELAAVLACAREQPLSAASGDFAFLLAALDRFVTAFGQPPLSGALPDMTCTTELFVALQTVYRRKADEDRAAFAAILKGLSDAHKHKGVSAEAVELFCRSARTVRLVSTSSMADSLKGARSAAVLEAARDPYADAAQTPILWYLALRAMETVRSGLKRYPGSGPEVERDVDAVWAELQRLATVNDVAVLLGDRMDLSPAEAGVCGVTRAHAEEVVAYADTQLHSLSALVGGLAAQEVVKIVTHQFVPLNSLFVFNGIACCGASYAL